MTLHRPIRLAAVTVAGAIALAACGSSSGTSGGSSDTSGASGASGGALSGTLAGAGSSAQTAAMQSWIAGFQSANPDVTVNYDPVGSGGGREQFIAGGTDFAGSDAYMSDDELAKAKDRCGSEAVDIPTYISPIAVVFNLQGVDSLNLTPDTVAGIFHQDIKKWNDPAIAADNPDAQLPDLAITPVNRSDPSGTTKNFTDYLSKAAPNVWTDAASEDWPVSGGEAANGTSGVIQAVGAGDGTVGYADASQAGQLGVASIKVGNDFVKYSPEAAAAVLEASTAVTGRPAGDLAIDVARDTTQSGVYPIVLVSYEIFCTKYSDATQGQLVKAFLSYIISSEGQQAAASAAGSAPLTSTLSEQAQSSIDMISK
ncbi:MAG: phosphate ABC transporter substrate-binding protein PstS [Geodermatophilaceae bacterium]